MSSAWRMFLDDERDPRDWFARNRVTGSRYDEEELNLNPRIREVISEGYWVVCRTAEEAKAVIVERGMPVFISFDHDLGRGPTGHDFAKWLVQQCVDGVYKFPDEFEYSVHSQNPVGARNIIGLLDGYLRSLPDR